MTQEQTITAEDVHIEKLAQVELIVTALENTANLVDNMEKATLGSHVLWLGGLPSSIANIQQQVKFMVEQTRATFGLPAQTSA